MDQHGSNCDEQDESLHLTCADDPELPPDDCHCPLKHVVVGHLDELCQQQNLQCPIANDPSTTGKGREGEEWREVRRQRDQMQRGRTWDSGAYGSVHSEGMRAMSNGINIIMSARNHVLKYRIAIAFRFVIMRP